MRARLSALLVAAGAITALASCGDPTAIKARLNNFEITNGLVYALNGGPTEAFNALRVRSAAPTFATPTFAFDIAFDITDTGTVRLFTARSLASEVVLSTNRVGLRDSPELVFDQVVDPPGDRFVFDSVLVVPVGRTVLIDVLDLTCQTEALLGFNIKAKLRIDSMNVFTRAMYFHLVSNPNCGFKQLVPGGQLPRE